MLTDARSSRRDSGRRELPAPCPKEGQLQASCERIGCEKLGARHAAAGALQRAQRAHSSDRFIQPAVPLVLAWPSDTVWNHSVFSKTVIAHRARRGHRETLIYPADRDARFAALRHDHHRTNAALLSPNTLEESAHGGRSSLPIWSAWCRAAADRCHRAAVSTSGRVGRQRRRAENASMYCLRSVRPADEAGNALYDSSAARLCGHRPVA